MFQRSLVTFSPTIKSVERLVSSSSGASPLPCQPDELLTYDVPSLRYHRLHPEYIHQRIERLGQSYNLRILLLMCDIVCPFHTHIRTSLPNRTPVRTPRPHSGAHKGVPAQQHHRHRSLVVSHLPPLLHSRTTPTPNACTHTHAA